MSTNNDKKTFAPEGQTAQTVGAHQMHNASASARGESAATPADPRQGRTTESAASISASVLESAAHKAEGSPSAELVFKGSENSAQSTRVNAPRRVSKVRVASFASRHVTAVSSVTAGSTAASTPISKRKVLVAVVAAFMAIMLAFTMSPVQGLADDLVNTIPANDGYNNPGVINTIVPSTHNAKTADAYVNGKPAATNVVQSTSTESATTFAAGLPLSTIYIDQEKIKVAKNGVFHYGTSAYSNPTYLKHDPSTGRVTLDTTREELRLYPNRINSIEGDLFYFIFPDAAILADGSTADLKITYSNPKVVVDQRYAYDNTPYQGRLNLATGANFTYGGTDTTRMADIAAASQRQTIVRNAIEQYRQYVDPPTTGNIFSNSNMKEPLLGTSLDAKYQVVNKNEVPIEGTFIYAISGINLDRDPYRGNNNNYAKPIWYIDKLTAQKVETFKETSTGEEYPVYTMGNTRYVKKDDGKYYMLTGSTIATNPTSFTTPPAVSWVPDGEGAAVGGDFFHFFSESMIINGGQASTYIYTRPNTTLGDDNTYKDSDPFNERYYFDQVISDGGKTRFIGNGYAATQGSDNKYCSGFVVLADAATGFTVTAMGHGAATEASMNTNTFRSTTIWYQYKSGSGDHGKIELTDEGNFSGKLSDGGKILSGGTLAVPNTYIVTEGKTVTYTMTPEVGYKAKKVTIKRADGSLKQILFNRESVSRMKKGDSITVDTADFNYWENPSSKEPKDPSRGQGILTYEGDGVYTFKYNHAKAHEEIYVEWEPTTADILAYKIWADDDDKDGIRLDADTNGTLPKYQLQWSKNGRDWNPVGQTMDIGITYTLPTPVTEQTVPAGKVGSDYKDGTYVINNGTPASVDPYRPEHPFTWEYLPVYTYDRSGRADKPIQYRIVEINDPWQYEYEKAKFYEHQIFDLTSSEENSIEGWGLFTDSTNTYIKRGDEEYDAGLYYMVDPVTGIADKTPATNQPREDSLKPVSSTGYWTEDHAVPYHEIEAKNEHYTSDTYVDVVKLWDDKIITQDQDQAETNEYARKDINIVLHAEIEDEATGTTEVVDLNPSDPSTTDLIKKIALGETDNKEDVTGYEEVDGYTKYVDQNNEEYVFVQNKENVQDGYYKIVSGAVDYTAGPYTFDKGAITPVKKNGDGTYKINNDRYGAMFEWLPTHYKGKHIIYTVKETDTSGNPLSEWIMTGGQLAEIKEGSKLLGYETTMRNTPDVDVEYTPVPLTIHKVDKTTGNPLEGAEFTIYLDPTPGVETKAPEAEDLVVGKTIYARNKNYILQRDTSDNKDKYYEVTGEEVSRTPAYPQPKAADLTDTGEKLNGKTIYNSTKNYIIQKDSSDDKYKYYEVVGGAAAANPADPQPSVADLVENGKLDGEDGYTDGTKTYVLRGEKYYEVDAEGNVSATEANPQPDPNVTRRAKDLKSGVVERNVVVTDARGDATVTFLVPNDEKQLRYYVKETKAPEGYYPDPDPYAFKIDADLKTITLEDPNYEHTTPWWQKLYDLIFGNETTYDNWAPDADNRGGILTVKDTPIVADILVRKYWNDNNDQDGKRPGDKNDPTSTADPNLPTVTLQYTLGAHTAAGSSIYTNGSRYYIHNVADDKYYEVDGTVTQGSYAGSAANPQPQAATLTETYDTCRNLTVYTDGTTKYVRVGNRWRVVNSVDVRNPSEDIIGTYQYSAADPQPTGAALVAGKTCGGLEVYKGTDSKEYVLIDHVYHLVDSVDVAGKVAPSPAAKQPDQNELELVLTGNWIDANVPPEYKDPHVSYVGGPVLTHQNDAYTWTSLPAYMDGKVVTYRILETGDILDNTKPAYAYDIESNHTSQTHEKTFNLVNNTGSEPTGLNQTVDVTNKHETQVVNIEAYKEWEDEDPADRSERKLYLYKVIDGIEYPITTLDEQGNIKEDVATVPTVGQPGEQVYVYTWKDQPTYENGKPVTYRIREEKPDGYITIYEGIYTNTAGVPVETSITDIKAEDIKRTFYERGDSIPEGKEVGSENTTARFKILNERSVNIQVKKTWVNGANANVTYELWRTTKPESELAPITRTNVDASDPNVYYVHKTIIISLQDYAALTDETEKAKYELKYVNNENPNDILTVGEWEHLDNPAQAAYERMYVNTSDPSDRITIAAYGVLSPKGQNSYTEQDYYVDNSDVTITKTQAEYDVLDPAEQQNYSKAYQDNEDPSVIIAGITYDTLSPTGQNNYAIKYVSKTDPEAPEGIIDEATWAALPNPEQAKYSQQYVDDKHAIISKDTYEALSPDDKAEYDIEATTSWSPYEGGGKEGATTVDGWELVGSHIFDSNNFVNPSPAGDKDTYVFDDLLIKDEHGNKYTYRILEKPALLRFRENQISATEVINNNVNVSDGNVSLEVVKELENRKWKKKTTEEEGDQFFFYLEPVKGVDITESTAPVDIAKDKVPMPYRVDPVTTKTEYNYTADAVESDLQVGAIGRAATFEDIQYKENSARYHSIDRGDIVEFYYRVYEVYSTKTEPSGDDTTITADKSLDEATNHTGYKDGITYAGTVSNLTAAEYNVLAAKGKDSYIQTRAYVNNVDPAEIISVVAYNALPSGEKDNYEEATGYVNINDADDLITATAYNNLHDVGKSSYSSQPGYLDKDGKAINTREYEKLSDEDKAKCTQAAIYSAFIPEVREAKVIAKNVDGIITTETQWLKDGEYKTGAVPVYTNSYSSEGYAKAWIEKKIAERGWADYAVDAETKQASGDAFSFTVESISGAALNVPGASSDSYTSKPLMPNAEHNPQTDIQKMSDTEYAFGLRGNKYDNTMLNSEGYAYFIYEISENGAVTYKDDNFEISNYRVDGLEYDEVAEGEPRKIYARLKAQDNWDGTISFEVDYFSDASCKPDYLINDHKAWIYDDDTETEAGKRLLNMAEAATAKQMTPEQQAEAHYREINVAYFVNYQSDDIPVMKQWVGGPAIEDVNLHLEEHLFPISGDGAIKESDITDAYIKAQEAAWKPEEHDGKAFWETAGYTNIVKRGDFLNSDGAPKYDPGSTDTSSNRYEHIEGFNKDLHQYIVKGGITYRVVYRLLEDDTSNTYERSYKSINVITVAAYEGSRPEGYQPMYENKDDKTLITPEEWDKLEPQDQAHYVKKYVKETEGDYIYTDGDTLVVTNTITATNVAKPAAVKQLLNRNWLDSDDFKFVLVPWGKYDKDGTFVETEDIPMPTTDEYVNKTDPKDVISKDTYEGLTPQGQNDYESTEAYASNADPSVIISADDYEALDPSLQDGYSPTTAYVNADGTELISAEAYDALNPKGQSSYEPKETSDEAHATKGSTVVDTEGNLERAARFGDIAFSAKDLVYHETDKHYHGDFFYKMKEDIPVDDVYAVDKSTLQKVLDDNDQEIKFDEAIRDDYYWKDDANGLIYDGSVHLVHIKVQENRTSELQVQVSYDETKQGDTSTGTPFTPVYTNCYDASLVFSQEIDKYIMGRDWKAGDVFDFRMSPLAGAPFVDADASEFPKNDTHSDDEREAELEEGYAIHSARGAHVKRLTVEEDAPSTATQKLMMPKLKFELSDLYKVVESENTLKYKDGTYVPVGMAYGQFVYSFEETNDYLDKAGKAVKDIKVDPDTEYVRITVIDTGTGSLDWYTEVFEDRYCTVPREVPGTSDPAINPSFVNQLKRDLSITKTWVGPARSDITLRLEWSVNAKNWYYVDDAEWMPAGIRNTQTIERSAFGDALTATWYNLPAYANIKNAYDQTGDDKALNDLWVYYRIVEDDISHVETRYSYEHYEPGDSYDNTDKYKKKDDLDAPHTGPEKEPNYTLVTPEPEDKPNVKGWYEKDGEDYVPTKDADVVPGKEYYEAGEGFVANRITQLYVTNWPEDISGEARVGVVKQYIGKAWINEEFTFEISPIESQIGTETKPVKEGAQRKTGNYVKIEGGKEIVITKAEYDAITDPEEKAKYSEQEITNVMPAYNKAHANTATARALGSGLSERVAVNEYSANFDPLQIKLSNLAVDTRQTIDGKPNPNYGKAVGTFYYLIKEQVPANAVTTDEPCGTDAQGNVVYYKIGTDGNLNKIKYTTEEHIVKIVAVDDGSGTIETTVSYDTRNPGEFVPVYTNVSAATGTVMVTKVWDDQGNKYNKRPTADEFKSMIQLVGSDGKTYPGTEATVTAGTDANADKYTVVWNDIPVFQAGKQGEQVLYSVAESGLSGSYEPAGQLPAGIKLAYDEHIRGWKADGGEFANKLMVIDLPVRKIWVDYDADKTSEESLAGIRPAEVGLRVTADTRIEVDGWIADGSTSYFDVVLTAADKVDNTTDIRSGVVWHKLPAQLQNLPRFQADGTTLIKYTVSEPNVPANYTQNTALGGFVNAVINIYQASTFSGTKQWVDGNQDHDNATELAGKLHVYPLKADGTPDTTNEIPNVHIDWSGDTFTIIGLPTEHQNYCVVEDAPEHYTASYLDAAGKPSADNWLEDGGTIVNTAAAQEVKVTKQWAGDAGHTDDRKDVKVSLYQIVDGQKRQALQIDGTPTEQKTLATGPQHAESLEASWSNLPVYEGTTNTPITYAVEEEPIAHYQASYAGDAASGFTITNTHAGELVTFVVAKHWNDNDNAQDTRPSTVTVRLYQRTLFEAAEWKPAVDGQGNEIEPAYLVEDDNWMTRFEDLPRFDPQGNRYFYHARELDAQGNPIEEGGTTAEGYTVAYADDDDSSTSITNTLPQTPYTSVSVLKKWIDNNDQDGIRPAAVTVRLLANGEPALDADGNQIAPAELNIQNNLAHLFTNLPVNDEQGNPITYTVEELTTDVITGKDAPGTYAIKITGDAAKGFTVTNIHTPEKVTVKAIKKWKGEDAVGTALRNDATLHLYGTYDGMIVYDAGTQTVDSDSDEPATWEGLPARHYNDEALTWQIVEEAMFGYTPTYEWDDAGTTCTVTNTYTQPTASITARKVWEDQDDHDSLRPDSITFVLWKKVGDAKEQEVAKQKVNKDSDWSYTWTDLPTSELVQGTGEPTEQPVLYTVREESAPKGYEAVTEAVAPGEFKVINTHKVEPDDLTLAVTKAWAGDDGDTSARSDVVFHLIRVVDGTMTDIGQEKVIPKDATGKALTVTWTGLPALVDGKSATYTVEEMPVPGYTTSFSDGVREGDTIMVTVTNTKVQVQKIWITYYDADGNKIVHEQIERGGNEPTQPADPTREGYTFGGWERTTLPDGSVEYKPKWIEVGKIKVRYIDPETGKVYENEVINRGDDEPAQPTDPTREGYTFGGWERIEDEHGNVTYQARWVKNTEPVEESKPLVTYLDPKAADAAMVLQARKYSNQKAADAEAANKADAPANPQHDGFEFVGWVVNQDEYGNYTLVAKYNQVAQVKTVSYIDPITGEVIVSKITDDPGSITIPDPAKHPNMAFDGWQEMTDASGNIIYVAKYKSDCANPAPAPDPVTPTPAAPAQVIQQVDPRVPVTSVAAASRTAQTGDLAPMGVLIVTAGSAAVVALAARRRAGQDAAIRAKHASGNDS